MVNAAELVKELRERVVTKHKIYQFLVRALYPYYPF